MNKLELMNEISNYPKHLIVKSIKLLGEESICGFSGLVESEVMDVLIMCEEYELFEVLRLTKHQAQKINNADIPTIGIYHI